MLGLGHAGLALATSVVALVNFAQLMAALRRRVELGSLGSWVGDILRCLAAALLCGAVAFGLNALVEGQTPDRWLRAGGLLVAIAAAVATYFAAARLLRLEESAEAWRMLRRRLPLPSLGRAR